MHTNLKKFRIKPGQEGVAREWFAWLGSIIAEGNGTLLSEGTHIESWFLSDEPSGTYGYVFEILDDPEHARRTFQSSENPIDGKHLEYMRRCVEPGSLVAMRPNAAFGDYSVFRQTGGRHPASDQSD